jgi:hypothetical protein
MNIRDLLNSIDALENQIQEGDVFHLDLDNLSIETTVAQILPEGIVIYIDETAENYLNLDETLEEAEYQGRKVSLGKPMSGDVKKSKVYVRKPNGKVVKVNFGDKKLSIKKHIPGRRKSFRARHNCDNPGPRWKARYWSCRAW